MNTTPSVLEGIRVIEIANWAAAPSAGAMLAEMGAEVIKVEPLSGDAMRGMMHQAAVPGAQEIDHPFQFSNRGKESVAIALDAPAGAELVLEMAAVSDVVICNLLPQRRDRLGLTVDAFQLRNEGLVVGLLTGYGEQGPDSHRPGYDMTSFFASSGLSASVAGANGAPPRWRAAQGDHVAGLSLFAGIMTALYDRTRTGKGQVVETSLLRSAVWTNAMELTRAAADGRPSTPRLRDQTINATVEAFQCSDERWIQVTLPEPVSGFAIVCEILEMEELLADPRFENPVVRFRNIKELIGILDEGFARFTSTEIARRFDERGASYGLVKTADEVVVDPQSIAAGVMRSVAHSGGDIDVVASPFSLDRETLDVRAFASVGSDTQQVLARVLGKDSEAVEELARLGIIGTGT